MQIFVWFDQNLIYIKTKIHSIIKVPVLIWWLSSAWDPSWYNYKNKNKNLKMITSSHSLVDWKSNEITCTNIRHRPFDEKDERLFVKQWFINVRAFTRSGRFHIWTYIKVHLNLWTRKKWKKVKKQQKI